MRLLTAVLFASLALAACGGGEGEGDLTTDDVGDMQEAVEGAPVCAELYAEGNVLVSGDESPGCP